MTDTLDPLDPWGPAQASPQHGVWGWDTDGPLQGAVHLLKPTIKTHTVHPDSRGGESHTKSQQESYGHTTKEHVGWDIVAVSLETRWTSGGANADLRHVAGAPQTVVPIFLNTQFFNRLHHSLFRYVLSVPSPVPGQEPMNVSMTSQRGP